MEIATYTLQRWGQDQAARYLDDLQETCRRLAHHPQSGRLSGEIKPGLRRIESGRHVIFYRVDAAGILISRILHQRMLPERYLNED